jgi:protein-S-isoprenylcysteine O-methyltransferase Ste14
MGTWCVLHSWLAALSTKQLTREIFGNKIDRFYRVLFVCIAMITLVPILAMMLFLPSKVLWVIKPPWLYVTIGLQLIAVGCILITIFDTDVMAFIGIKQLIHPQIERENTLIIKRFYKYIRHPMYFFSLVLLWLIPYMTNLVMAWVIISTVYFLVGSIIEERKMRHTFGEPYVQYQKKVGWFIPALKRKQK